MNIPCANDDEDFPVFKAGPPLPIRTKTKPSCKIKGNPLKATSSIPPRSSSKQGSSTATQASTNSAICAESKVKQYIEKVKASDEIGRKKRIKPEQMLSLEDLYQVNVTSDTKGDRSYNHVINNNGKQDMSPLDVQDKLRETLRIVKEKDELINKLRESCHDLAIKCADAENRVDELRFSYGRSSFSAGNDKEAAASSNAKTKDPLEYSAFIPRRCVSEEGLQTCGVDDNDGKRRSEEKTTWKKIDKATETHNDVMKYDAHTQIETRLCPADQCVNDRLSDKQVCQCNPEDDILQETCSNWLEKVQNWKTDSTFNLSQDSGGDKDSGFRGSSAEIDAESVMKNRHLSVPKSHRKCQGHRERSLKVPHNMQRHNTAQPPQMSSLSTTTITAHPEPVCNPRLENHEEEEEHSTQQHFWPSFSSSQSHFHLSNYHSANFQSDSTKAKSLFYEMAEADRNKYACFQEKCRNKHHHRSEFQQQHRLGGAKSLDVLYIPPSVSQPSTEELKSLIDSSFDPPEFILKSCLNSQHRSVDKKVKLLGPLLDDTTQIALRVKMKSERLAKMLNDACTLE